MSRKPSNRVNSFAPTHRIWVPTRRQIMAATGAAASGLLLTRRSGAKPKDFPESYYDEMDYDEALYVVSEFERRGPLKELVNYGDGLLGVQVEANPEKPRKKPRIEVQVTQIQLVPPQLRSGDFSYRYKDDLNEDKTLGYQVKQSATFNAFQAGVRLGEKAQRDSNTALPGVAGWTFRFDSRTVILTAYHVLCNQQWNNTPVGTTVNVRVGDEPIQGWLHCYQKMKTGATLNKWDLALARVNDADARGRCAPCEANESPYPYPLDLCPSVSPGQSFHKVGKADNNNNNRCATGTLRKIGSCTLQFAGFSTPSTFTGQLFFSNMAEEGDSGAVVVRDNDNKVAGLIFTGDNEYTVANPIYLLPWERLSGNHTLPNGEAIPRFASLGEGATGECFGG